MEYCGPRSNSQEAGNEPGVKGQKDLEGTSSVEWGQEKEKRLSDGNRNYIKVASRGRGLAIWREEIKVSKSLGES